MRTIPSALITDSRSVYDRMMTEVLVINRAKKKTSIELLGLKASQQMTTGQRLRCVHSEAQLANAMAKNGPCRELELSYRMQHAWKVVEDEMMRSARRRRQEGIQPLDGSQNARDEKEVVSREMSTMEGKAGGMQVTSA